MPSVKLSLGRYVTLRPRRDGTYRVFFQVPERLRPSGWLALIPLPIAGERKGDLTDAAEVARIQTDAATLYTRLLADRAATAPAGAPIERRDMPTLIRKWQATQAFKDTKPRTQQGYVYHGRLVEAWSQAAGHPLVAAMSKDRVEEFLALYDDRPTTRRHILIVLKMLLKVAIDLDWIAKSPVANIKSKAPKTKVVIWELEDVRRFAHAAIWARQPALAALILTQWEIGQRLTDVRLFRGSDVGSPNAEYHSTQGVFRFWQSKTESYVTVPVSAELRALLASVKVEGSLYLFLDAHDLQPFDEQRLGHLFIDLKASLAEGRKFTLRGLRHSCVVQLARAGCTVAEVASITGHSIASVEQILSVYLPRDNEVAWNAQAKRGLVKHPKGKATR